MDYIKGGLTSIVLYFTQAITTGEIVQGCDMLCYLLLGIHRDTDREGRYEYYQLPSVDWVKVSLFEEDYGSKKRVRSEGRKREYEGFFW